MSALRPDLRLLGAGAREVLLAAVGCGALAGGLAVLQAGLLAGGIEGAFLHGADLAASAPLLAGLGAAALARAAAAASGDVLAQLAASRSKASLRVRIAARLVELGPRFTSGERTGELAQTTAAGVETLEPYLAQLLPQLALAILVPGLILVAVLAADPLSALVLLVTYPLVPLFMALVGSLAQARTRRQWVLLQRLSARLLDGLTGLGTLVALGRDREHARELAADGERFRKATMGVLRIAFLSALVLELVATIGTALLAVQVGLRLLYGRVDFGPALFVLLLAPEFYRPLRALGAAFHAGLPAREASARIVEVLDAPVLENGGEAPPRGLPDIELDEVSFAYAPGRPALQGVSLRLEPGTTTALVGPSGSGKSTVAALLLRFLEPDRGVLRADGHPLAGIDAAAWRRRVAWVPQRPYLFHGTLLENLRLARPDAPDEALREAARLAAVDEFVGELPQGWNTPLGEAGQRLASGQAQRLALARAFLRDAPLLVLDEPTAHLDPEQDDLLRAAIERLRGGRTVLLIAHRLASVTGADRVAVLDRGRLLEQGRPGELRRAGGAYARLLAAAEGRS